MDESPRDQETQDEVKLPDERVEDLEPEGEDSAGVKGGFAKIEYDYGPPPPPKK